MKMQRHPRGAALRPAAHKTIKSFPEGTVRLSPGVFSGTISKH
jgi:hypothetical protein